MPRRPADLPRVQFDNARLARVGVEVLALPALSRMARLPATPQRVDFLHLMIVTRGSFVHAVDFQRHRVRGGQAVLVRPGQVQQWNLAAGIDGWVTLAMPEALPPGLAFDEWPSVWTPAAPLFHDAAADVRRMARDIDAFAGRDAQVAVIRHALFLLMLRLADALHAPRAGASPDRAAQVHRLFARELDANYMHRWSVLDYAKRLGYSESTLTRACLAAVGRTAKEAIDERVALEARRLLAHSAATVVEIGHLLGFSEPTNFVKFFRRVVGTTPQAFRAGAAGAS